MGDFYGQRGAEADGWVEKVSWNRTNLKGSLRLLFDRIRAEQIQFFLFHSPYSLG